MKHALARNHAKAAPVLLFISKSSRLCLLSPVGSQVAFCHEPVLRRFHALLFQHLFCNAIKLNFTVAWIFTCAHSFNV